jgi:hypothetical protein
VECGAHVREIYWLCLQYDTTILAVYIPGRYNTLADRISQFSYLRDAFDARLLLAGFSNSVITCKNHMTQASFCYLQERWMLGSSYYVERPQI